MNAFAEDVRVTAQNSMKRFSLDVGEVETVLKATSLQFTILGRDRKRSIRTRVAFLTAARAIAAMLR